MKKNLTAAALSLLVCLSLSACGGSGAGGASAGISDSGSAQSSIGASAAGSGALSDESGRPLQGVIPMTVEGEREEVPATLYQGEGWSLYLPDTGWEKDAEKEQWKAAENDLVLLGVWSYPGLTAEQGRQEVLGQYGDYYGFRDLGADNTFSGYNGKDGQTMDVCMIAYDGGVFALWSSYPDAAEEGFLPRLKAIADTFVPDAPAAVRPIQTTLAMTVEGERESVLVTLYAEDGWSIYIPSEGWRLDVDPEDREVSWESADNDDAQLSVRVWPGLGKDSNPLDALFAAFERTEGDFTFTVEDNCLAGTDARDGESMIVYPSFSGDDAFTVAIQYPAAAAEGFGVRLAAIAGTFRVD